MQGHPLGLARCGACRTTTATPAPSTCTSSIHRLADARSTTSWKVTSCWRWRSMPNSRSDDNKDFRCHSRFIDAGASTISSNPQVHRQQTVGIPVLLLRTPRYSMTVFCSPQKTLPHQMCSTLVTVRAHMRPRRPTRHDNTTHTSHTLGIIDWYLNTHRHTIGKNSVAHCSLLGLHQKRRQTSRRDF